MTPQNTNYRKLIPGVGLHQLSGTTPQEWRDWLWEHIASLDEATILELGYGIGEPWATQNSQSPTGWCTALTDISYGIVRHCQTRLNGHLSRPGLTVINAGALPWKDEQFNIVIADLMLYHVEALPQALTEIKRVLTRDGMLYASTVGAHHMRELWSLLEPFIPDIHDRIRRMTAGFNLENGKDKLQRVFDDITCHVYEDILTITSIKPAIADLRSLPVLKEGELHANDWAHIRRQLVANIEIKGAYYVTQHTGLFIART